MAFCRPWLVLFNSNGNLSKIISTMAAPVAKLHSSGKHRHLHLISPLYACTLVNDVRPLPSQTVNYNSVVVMAPIHTGQIRQAGHNKWSKVKHIKGPKDLARSKEFGKMIQKIKFAVQSDGADPELNSSLANLMQMARSIGMPKSTIEGVIAKAGTGSKGVASTSVIFEARGPAGSCLLLEVLTDNTNRTRQELRTILRKLGCSLGEPGTAMYAFAHKGVIRVSGLKEDGSTTLLDEALEVAIVSGAEDVMETESENGEQILMFVCDPKEVRKVRENLESENFVPVSVNLEYLAQSSVTLKDSELENAAEVINQVLDHMDVVKVYDNIESEN
ncbi:translational activator of cytochrome c oxidase 1-like [Ptychodera flava]|uniref:translational activator of cytochrome c oxidase 1-like n=1 Tax=Ptychodera flava TaxID=63121 RepID=UPI00396AA38B